VTYQIQKAKTLIIFIGIVLILGTNSIAYSQDPPKWFTKLRQIKPMTTTKQEIELDYGPGKSTKMFGEKTYEYSHKEGNLIILYSSGKCSETNLKGYNVPRDVVVMVRMFLKKEFGVGINNLISDLREFKKDRSDLLGSFVYTNDKTGEYYFGEPTNIREIGFRATKEQWQKLDCEKISTGKTVL
jgi:hypothetical protein